MMSKCNGVVLVAAVTVSLAACELMTEATEACTRELGVAVDPTDAMIHLGQTFQVEAHGTSCGGKEIFALDVQWESTDSAVIRVEPTGRVTGVGVGKARVLGVDHSHYGAGTFEVPVDVSE